MLWIVKGFQQVWSHTVRIYAAGHVDLIMDCIHSTVNLVVKCLQYPQEGKEQLVIAISLQRLELKGNTKTINFAIFAVAVNLQNLLCPIMEKAHDRD